MVNTLSSKDLERLLRFALDPVRQSQGGQLALTLLDIEQIMGEGKLGPDGALREDARRVKRPAVRRAGAKQGHWELTQGAYWATYNERIEVPEGALLVLQPHPALLRNGVWHPTMAVRDWDRDGGGVLLVVSARGVRVEESTPISVGFVIT